MGVARASFPTPKMNPNFSSPEFFAQEFSKQTTEQNFEEKIQALAPLGGPLSGIESFVA